MSTEIEELVAQFPRLSVGTKNEISLFNLLKMTAVKKIIPEL